jgi:hypothetical protein
MNKDLVSRHKLRSAQFALVLAVFTSLTIPRLSAAQNPPEDASGVFPLEAPLACPFDVELSLIGKSKTIDLPGGGFIVTSPGLFVTVTNLDDPTRRVTLNITGASHRTMDQDGNVVTVYTGRNLNLDPEAGFVLVVGHFSIVSDAAGNLLQPLGGQGQLLDVCEMIQ